MYKNKRILAVIPARGGSKGIKNKNLRKINNKSLLAHTIILAKKIKIIDKIIVSSDSSKILEESEKLGLKTYFKRSKKLSGDKVGDLPVLIEAISKTEKKTYQEFDVIAMLQPTAPLRTIKDVKNAIVKCIDKNYDAVWTVSRIDKKFHPLKQLVLVNENLELNDKKGKKIIARQQLKNTYFRNGAAYVYKKKILTQKKNFYPNQMGYIISLTKQISIDTIKDLKLAKKYFNV